MPMSSTGGGGKTKTPSLSASSISADTASGYHVLRINGYSCTKDTPNGKCLKSLPFTVGGHRWRIKYYPNGYNSEATDYFSFVLLLDESVAEAVKAQFEFRFVGEVTDLPVILGEVDSYGGKEHSGCGYTKFIKRDEFEKSKHLQDDSFAIRCDVAVLNEFRREEETPEAPTPVSVPVPPSDLHQHLGDLLLTEKGADVVFEVGSQTFAAHRCVLAARSPVFSAELFGPMKEGNNAAGVVCIDDMEAEVFRALLCFVYTDQFPKTEKEEAGGGNGEQDDVLAQHLLVAADRYNMERLKLLCQDKLCNYIGVSTVATILALAEQHHCHGLKKVCIDFLSSPGNLRAAVASDGFKHLIRSCPSVMEELMTMLATQAS